MVWDELLWRLEAAILQPCQAVKRISIRLSYDMESLNSACTQVALASYIVSLEIQISVLSIVDVTVLISQPQTTFYE